MQLQHTFGYDCEGLSSLITNNKLSSFTKKLVELGKQQDPDLYDPLSFMGDGFEWFVEYFFKFFNGDHTLTYTADYEPNYDYDRGIDGRGISTLDGKPNVIQCKFKADPNKYLTNEDNISTVAADATTGVITLALTADQTSNLEDGRYVYDLEILQTSSSTVTRVIEGIITVRPQVTT